MAYRYVQLIKALILNPVCVLEILKISEVHDQEDGLFPVYLKVHTTKAVWSLALTLAISSPA